MGQIATVIVYGALVAASYALEMPLVKRSFEIFITNIGFLAGILRLGIWGVKSSLFPWDHQGAESGTVHYAAVDSKSLVGAAFHLPHVHSWSPPPRNDHVKSTNSARIPPVQCADFAQLFWQFWGLSP